MDAFDLQRTIGRLHRCIVPAIALAAHGDRDAARLEHLAVVAGGILRTAIRVMHQAGLRIAPPQCHPQGRRGQFLGHRIGTDRVLRFAFELATRRARKHVTIATKSNGIAISMPYWDERAAAMGAQYPQISTDKQHIDILSARFVLQPDRFDVVVASNLFGDILSDLGPACTGTIGLAPSANLNPERNFPSLFEPVHGSAPDICGQNIANPVAMIWSGALMLEFLGLGLPESEQKPYLDAHNAIVKAIEQVLSSGPRTRDLGGQATTTEMGEAISKLLAK